MIVVSNATPLIALAAVGSLDLLANLFVEIYVPDAVYALPENAYKIAVTHRRTIYDALYLTLNVRESCQFVTADEKLVNAIGAAYSNLI